MDKYDFINVSKRMVKEYYNRYVAKTDEEQIRLRNVHIVGLSDINGDYKIILSTPNFDGTIYKVTYDKIKDEIKSYIEKMSTGFRKIK